MQQECGDIRDVQWVFWAAETTKCEFIAECFAHVPHPKNSKIG